MKKGPSIQRRILSFNHFYLNLIKEKKEMIEN